MTSGGSNFNDFHENQLTQFVQFKQYRRVVSVRLGSLVHWESTMFTLLSHLGKFDSYVIERDVGLN